MIKIDAEKLINSYLEETDWRVKENANMRYSYPGLLGFTVGHATAEYALSNIYPKEASEAHRNCDIHIHDLSGLCNYCLGLDFEMFLMKGLDDIDGPPKHFTSALAQLHNLIFLVSQQINGAIAFNSVDILLAPYIRKDGLTYKQIKQALQEFVYTINIPGRIGFQCVDKDTEVLTPNGFKKYNGLKINDDIYTWKDSKLNIQKVKNVNINHFKGKMHVYEGRDYIQQVTDNHRVLRKKYNSSEYQLIESSKIFGNKSGIQMPIAFSGLNYETTDGLSDDLRKLLVFVLTDGTIEPSGNRVKIYKSTTRWGNEQLVEILNNLGFKYTVKQHDTEFGSTINTYDICAEDSRVITSILGNNKRTIPEIFFKMNKEEAKSFLALWVKLDGNESGKIKLQCDNYEIANSLQQIAVIAGFGSNITSRMIGSNKKETIYLMLYKRKNKQANKMYEVDYDDIVWCPSTDDGIVVYRKNGKVFISGNSPFVNFQLDITVPKRLRGRGAAIADEWQDYSYEDLRWEIEAFNKALLEVLSEAKTVKAFPVINIGITKEFNWDSKLSETIFSTIGKVGQPTINNYVNGGYDPDAVKSMCCSLRLDFTEIIKQTGGQFGAADNSGSTGVGTMNLPRYGYLARIGSGSKIETLLGLVERNMNLILEAQVSKRIFIEDMLKRGMYPTVSRFIDDFSHFFVTVGAIGLNEMCMNFFGDPTKGIDTPEGKQLSIEVIQFMNKQLSKFQVAHKDFYGPNRPILANLELVPGEGCMHRFARHDKIAFPDIITANGTGGDYYTRGCWLPADKQYSLSFATKHQEELQDMFSGGANFQYYINEPIHDWRAVRSIVKKIVTNTSLPFVSISPTISVCPICGVLQNNQDYCEHELSKEQIAELKAKGVEVIE